MPDIFTKEKRSEIMSCIRSKNTNPEKIVFSYLRLNKIYFQKHYSKVVGKPDIAIPSKKKAVFIDGDFWHGYKFKEREDKLPEVYWREKIRSNIERDIKNRKILRKKCWKVLRIWEHQLNKNPEKTLERILFFLVNN